MAAPQLIRRYARALLVACAVLVTFVGTSAAYHLWKRSGPCMVLVDDAEDRDHREVRQAGRGDVTLVTAYLNIGTFDKGNFLNQRNADMYRNWIRIFASIRNPVVAYFDEHPTASYFQKLRRGLPTRTLVVDRDRLWAFSLKSEIEAIFHGDDYPKNEPKSTNADYACAMHAKFEFVTHAVQTNYFGTEHFAWLDAGFFRDLVESGDLAPFTLNLPLCHNPLAVAFSAVQPLSNATVDDIMREGIDWVSGGLFLATGRTMMAFTADYRRHAETLLRGHRLANADQAVIHVMYSPFNLYGHAVPLQAFLPWEDWDPWFYLGYLMRQLSMGDRDERADRPRSETCHSEMFY